MPYMYTLTRQESNPITVIARIFIVGEGTDNKEVEEYERSK